MVTTVSPTMVDEPASDDRWRFVAIGALIDDLSPSEIARYAAAPEVAVAAAITSAGLEGAIEHGRIVDARWAARIIDTLDSDTRHQILAAIGRRLLAAADDDLDTVIGHCRAAARSLDTAALIEMAEHAGNLRLSTRTYASAARHLALAVDLSGDTDPALGERLLLLARATDGTGDLDTAREILMRAAGLGSVVGDAHLVARAAVRYALPSDWFAGDHRAMELLRMADAMDLTEADRAMVTAASGLVEMRIPVVHDDDNQYAWITRPDTAQPITDAALEATSPDWHEARATALLAWRATHRAPQFLTRRRAVTTELVESAHRMNEPWMLVMGAEWAAVDAIESGDRAAHDRFVAVARWAAEHDGNPRLRWRAGALAAGAAHLDGELDQAHDLLGLARDAIAATSSPCWMGAEILFLGEEVVSRDDPDEFAAHLDHDSTASRLNPLAQASMAYVYARVGRRDMARPVFERSWRALDSESSMLLHASRLAAAAIELDDVERIEALIDLFEQYADHVVVDAHGWWIDGPVRGWLAMLHAAAGRAAVAAEYLDRAVEDARALNDVRSLKRLDELAARLSGGSVLPSPGLAGAPTVDLAERERAVLRLLAEGRTNAEIGRELSFSVSTIRNSTVAIYKALGVKGRADAVAAAHRLGLLNP